MWFSCLFRARRSRGKPLIVKTDPSNMNACYFQNKIQLISFVLVKREGTLNATLCDDYNPHRTSRWWCLHSFTTSAGFRGLRLSLTRTGVVTLVSFIGSLHLRGVKLDLKASKYIKAV